MLRGEVEERGQRARECGGAMANLRRHDEPRRRHRSARSAARRCLATPEYPIAAGFRGVAGGGEREGLVGSRGADHDGCPAPSVVTLSTIVRCSTLNREEASGGATWWQTAHAHCSFRVLEEVLLDRQELDTGVADAGKRDGAAPPGRGAGDWSSHCRSPGPMAGRGRASILGSKGTATGTRSKGGCASVTPLPIFPLGAEPFGVGRASLCSCWRDRLS